MNRNPWSISSIQGYYTIETSINRVPRERPRDPDPLMF